MTTFVRVAGGLYYPQRFNLGPITNTPILTNQGIGTAVTDYFAMAFTIPKDGTLDGWESGCATHTLSGSHTLRFGWRDYDESTGSFGAVAEVVTGSPTANTWYSTASITNAGVKRTVVRGQRLCAVIDFTAWTAGTFQQKYFTRDASEAWPYVFWKVGAGAETFTVGFPVIILRYDDGTYAVPVDCLPVSATTTRTFSSNTELRQRFTPKFDLECDGADFHLNNANDQLVTCTLATDGGATLAASTFSNLGTFISQMPFRWAPVTLTAGTYYGFVLTGSSTTTVSTFSYAVNTDLYQALAQWGAGGSVASRVGGGGWSAEITNENIWGWLHLAGLPVGPATPPTPGGDVVGPPRYAGMIAEWARNEYLISNGSETFGVTLGPAVWRALGIGCTELYYEPDVDVLAGAFNSLTWMVEQEGVLFDGESPIALTVETPSVSSDAAVPMRLRRLYVEAYTRGESVVPTVVLDNTEIALAAFSTTARTTVEYALDRSARTCGVRLSSTTLRSRVDVFGVEVDYYVPVGEPDASFQFEPAQEVMDP